ncbi:ABC transporter ATP-binding protein [Sphingomonas aurantiaca]|uniref:ABC transporter ATP-binding protein n=1 Tax=Sphingomonas aurantiaca TaxID=185949 RepID=UPI002FE136A0
MDLIVDALSVKLGKRIVLHDASAHLRPGRVTAILGPNGAGKSTLVKAAAALVGRAGGCVRLDAQDVATMDPRVRARAIGYLPQDATVHWNIVARDVVALGRLPHLGAHAAPSPEDRAAVDRAMHDTETTHLADRPVGELSGGERARVLLARVFAGEPRWLLADEPLASLDPAHQIDLLARLQNLCGGRGRGRDRPPRPRPGAARGGRCAADRRGPRRRVRAGRRGDDRGHARPRVRCPRRPARRRLGLGGGGGTRRLLVPVGRIDAA